GGERLALAARLHGVVEDAQVQVEAGRAVAFVDQHVPERQRVLAAGDGHQDRLVLAEHAVLADGLAHLGSEGLLEVRRAEGGVGAPKLQHRRAAALAALHARPPDITGRSSMVSSSFTCWSAVMRSSPRMTRTVSGRMSSSRRTSFTRRLPATSTSRRGLRSTTFIALGPWEPRRALDPADLPQVHGVVSRGQAPPLAEVHVPEAEMPELELARIARGQSLYRL